MIFTDTSNCFTELPIEVLNRIISNLELKDLLSLTRCNKKLRFDICDNAIWRGIANKLWKDYEGNDSLVDFSGMGFEVIIQKGPRVTIDWYAYCMNRMFFERKVFYELKEILEFQHQPAYWKKMWKYFNVSAFAVKIPLLIDIVDSDLIRGIGSYRFDRLKLLGYANPSLPMKKIASELLSAFRHKRLFYLTTFYYAGDGLFDYNYPCEHLLLDYSTIDTAYHRLIPYRNMFMVLVDRILNARQKQLNEKFQSLPPLRQIGILAQTVMGILRNNATHYLKKIYTEDLMLLRVYAGETKGFLLIHLAILQRVLNRYGLKSEILQRHLKVDCSADFSDQTQKRMIFLSVSEDTLRHKLFTEEQLKAVVDARHFQHYMQPLSKQDALKWMYNESLLHKESNYKDPEIYLGIDKWDEIYRHSRGPFSTPIVKAFNGIYRCVCADNTVIGPPMRLSQIIYSCFDDVMSAMTPLDYESLEFITEKQHNNNGEYDNDEYTELHEIWLEDQYLVKYLMKQIQSEFTGKISCIEWDAFFCVLGVDIEDSETLLVMDTFGEVSKVNKNIVEQNEVDSIKPERRDQLQRLLKNMQLSGKLGLLFDHFDIENHKYVLLPELES